MPSFVCWVPDRGQTDVDGVRVVGPSAIAAAEDYAERCCGFYDGNPFQSVTVHVRRWGAEAAYDESTRIIEVTVRAVPEFEGREVK